MSKKSKIVALAIALGWTTGCRSSPTPNPRHSDDAAFVLMEFGDTIAVERFAVNERSRRSSLVLNRAMKVRVEQDLTPSGAVIGYRYSIEQPPKTTAGDSAVPTLGTSEGSASLPVPYWAGSFSLIEQAVMQARADRGERGRALLAVHDVPMRYLVGGASVMAQITLRADTAWIKIGSLQLTAVLDERGRIVRASARARGLTVERRSSLPADAYAIAPLYASPAGTSYASETVRFKSEDGVWLEGTLSVPARQGAPGPAVVLLHGSGGGDRNNSANAASIEPALVFRQLADTLARRGIAVLRFDKRGRGGSGGTIAEITLPLLAADAHAAVAYLRARADVDPSRVALLGESEGAALILLVAQRDSQLCCAVLMAGPGSPTRDFVRYQQRKAVELDASIAVSARDSVVQSAMTSIEKEANTDPYTRSWLAFDAPTTASTVRLPALLLAGSSDRIVPPDDAARLGTALRRAGAQDVSVRVLPGLDHLFLRNPSGDRRAIVDQLSFTIPREVRGIIADWLATHLALNEKPTIRR